MNMVQVADGERLPLSVKELGSCDLYPQVSAAASMFDNVKFRHIYNFLQDSCSHYGKFWFLTTTRAEDPVICRIMSEYRK